ncbi:MAG: hypothetical protein GC178_10685 [Flavobacteriales bacterium]|nr:hypothetical protein [Flavobacteriales bacterium]
MVILSSSSCDIINPKEKIPSFIRVDSIRLQVSAGQGNPVQNFTDAWLFEEEKMVGIYELPATFPILKDGVTSIRIQGGVKLNGQVATRIPYFYTEDYLHDVELFPDSVIHINPTLKFKDWVTFDWLEDFDNGGLTLTLNSPNSQGTLTRVSGSEAYDGQSIKLSLGADETFIECKKGGDPLSLGDVSTPAMIEFTYRCNNSFAFGLYSTSPGNITQQPIIFLNPKEEWNHIYINLTDAKGNNPNFYEHRPYFGFFRDDGLEGEAYVYIDNIRLVH